MDDMFSDIDDPYLAPATTSALLDGMNDAQIRAITFGNGACLVVAGAGSGKTTVMTKRVAFLVESGVRPEEILLLTFTNKAAGNMIERARRFTPFADRVTSGTFHSIGFRLLRENAHLFNLPAMPSVMDPADAETAFKAIAKEIGDKDENLPNAKTLAKIHSFVANTMRDVEDVVYEKYEDLVYALSYIREAGERYRKYKRERALFDYDDLLLIWNRLLDDPEIAREMRQRFKYVMVDEHQDSNALQCAIIEKLGGTSPNVMVVGDPAQAIYGFRGAAPRTMFAFKELWSDAEVIYLNTNYRSTEDVLAVGNAVDRSMTERFDRLLEAAPGAKGDAPKIVDVPSQDQEATFIATSVLENKRNGIPLHEQAVLVRSLHAARGIELAFAQRRIPYTVFGGIKVSEARHIKDFLAIVRCAVNPLDEPAWIRALGMAKGIGPAMGGKVFKMVSAANADMASVPRIVMEKTKNNPDVAKVMQAWELVAASKGKPSDALEAALKVVAPLFSALYQEEWRKSRKQDVETVIAMSSKFDDLTSYLSTLTLDHNIEKTNGGYMDGSEAPVTISTVHSAKGLEWDAVFMPGFMEGHYPSSFARDHESLEEEKRILYVAVTRPRMYLTLSVPSVGFQGNRNERSRFEADIVDLCSREKWGNPDTYGGFRFGGNGDKMIDLSDL